MKKMNEEDYLTEDEMKVALHLLELPDHNNVRRKDYNFGRLWVMDFLKKETHEDSYWGTEYDCLYLKKNKVNKLRKLVAKSQKYHMEKNGYVDADGNEYEVRLVKKNEKIILRKNPRLRDKEIIGLFV